MFNINFLIIYLGICIIHANITSIFLLIPNLLIQTSDFSLQGTKFYLPIIALSAFISFPILFYFDKNISKNYFIFFTMTILALSNVMILCFHFTYLQLFICLTIFFIGFNILEANFPSIISKLSDKKTKGTILGIYSCFQFMGIFVGG